MPGHKSKCWGAPRTAAVGFSLGGNGFIGTGISEVLLKDFWLYDPGADTWTQKADFGGTPRYWATGFGIGSKGYIGAGTQVAAVALKMIFRNMMIKLMKCFLE